MWSISQKVNSIPDVNLELKNEVLSPTVKNILRNRGYYSVQEILAYLRPSLFDFHSPFLFKDMEKVILRLEKALQLQEKVLIYGDYDADGVTGTALLYKVLKRFGFNILVHIPNREEGYGLHQDVIEKAADKSLALIITVDCGITAVEETLLAAGMGIDVIITDHHEPPAELPAALGILNPKTEDSGYPFRNLAGVGVVLKLAQALYSHFEHPFETAGSEKEYLDLAALGTIADIVPLQGENRVIVKYGLKVLENTKHIGLKALLAECGLEGKRLKAGQISFIVAPRVNAAGRMDTARLALNLLLAEEYEEAMEIARALSSENYERQLTERKMFEEALKMLDAGPLPEVIVLSSPDWHQGVIGIVASRLVERFQRPVYLISEEGETGKGSARGIPGYHVYEELTKQAALLMRFGGHQKAAGFTLAVHNIGAFRERINQSFSESGLVYQEEYAVDSILACEEVSLDLQKELEQMAPFGAGNPAPLLLTNNLAVKKLIAMGKQSEHLKLLLEAGRHKLEAVAFKKGQELERLKNYQKIDIIYSLEVNDYYGEDRIQAILKDYRQANGDSLAESACSEDKAAGRPDQDSACQEYYSCQEEKDRTILTRQMLVDFYRELRGVADSNNTLFWQPQENTWQSHGVRIFEELGLITWLGGTGPCLIRLDSDRKTDLQRSLRFKMLS